MVHGSNQAITLLSQLGFNAPCHGLSHSYNIFVHVFLLSFIKTGADRDSASAFQEFSTSQIVTSVGHGEIQSQQKYDDLQHES
jgi:hypothetical protein